MKTAVPHSTDRAKLAKTWNEWGQLPTGASRNQRNLDKDRLTMLYRSPLLDELTLEERHHLPEWTALSVNDSFIFLEQLLLYSNHFLKKSDGPETSSMDAVGVDELWHLRSFRRYSTTSPQYHAFYRDPRRQQIPIPGHCCKDAFPRLTQLLLFCLRKSPRLGYLAFLYNELFSIEVGKTLVKDHGTASQDLLVQLHRLHLVDESRHIRICLEEIRSIYVDSSWARKWRFWLGGLFFLAVLSTIFTANLARILSMLHSRNSSALFRARFWLAALGIGSYEKSCGALAMNTFRKLLAQTLFSQEKATEADSRSLWSSPQGGR